jgi:hypothetical protein
MPSALVRGVMERYGPSLSNSALAPNVKIAAGLADFRCFVISELRCLVLLFCPEFSNLLIRIPESQKSDAATNTIHV